MRALVALACVVGIAVVAKARALDANLRSSPESSPIYAHTTLARTTPARVAPATSSSIAPQPLESSPSTSSTPIDSSECDDLCQAIIKRTIASKNKSSKYFGVGVGVSLLNSAKGGGFSINNNIQSPYANPIIIPSFGVRMGTISFFNRYVGVRGFLGFDMGFGAHSGKLVMISAGVDAIAEVPLSRRKQVFLGGILGMGADAYLYFDEREYNHWGVMKKAGEVFMQVGFTTMLGVHNRVNLVYRFLPARRATYFSPTGIVSLEYNFLF